MEGSNTPLLLLNGVPLTIRITIICTLPHLAPKLSMLTVSKIATYPKSVSLLDGVGRDLLALRSEAVGVKGAHQTQGGPGNGQGSFL